LALERSQISGSTQNEKFELITTIFVGTKKPDAPDNVQCEIGTRSPEIDDIGFHAHGILDGVGPFGAGIRWEAGQEDNPLAESAGFAGFAGETREGFSSSSLGSLRSLLADLANVIRDSVSAIELALSFKTLDDVLEWLSGLVAPMLDKVGVVNVFP